MPSLGSPTSISEGLNGALYVKFYVRLALSIRHASPYAPQGIKPPDFPNSAAVEPQHKGTSKPSLSMSKPISFGFAKSKSLKPSTPSASPTSQKAAKKDPLKKPLQKPLHTASDSEDESAPQHESVTGFDLSGGGAISSQSAKEKEELVISNPGNADWRQRGRGKNLLPPEVQAQRKGARTDNNQVERDEISKAAGLQFATKRSEIETQPKTDASINGHNVVDAASPPKPRTEDEIALQALLNEGSGERRADLIIQQSSNNATVSYDEEADFQADIASRPDSCTLEEYAAMPVEDFGLAMLRGMGTKRKANGQPVEVKVGTKNGNDSKSRDPQPRSGYLGIGAKGVPAGGDVELGAWGKADMRRNKKGEGLYTPVTLMNKATGEKITEQEFEARQQATKNGRPAKEEEDWRDRRDRNLQEKGRGRLFENTSDRESSSRSYKDQMGSFSRSTASNRDIKEKRNGHSSRDRSRSRERDERYRERREFRDNDHNGHSRERNRDFRDQGYKRDKYTDEDRYASSSSGEEGHRDGRRSGHDRDGERWHRERY